MLSAPKLFLRVRCTFFFKVSYTRKILRVRCTKNFGGLDVPKKFEGSDANSFKGYIPLFFLKG